MCLLQMRHLVSRLPLLTGSKMNGGSLYFVLLCFFFFKFEISNNFKYRNQSIAVDYPHGGMPCTYAHGVPAAGAAVDIGINFR